MAAEKNIDAGMVSPQATTILAASFHFTLLARGIFL